MPSEKDRSHPGYRAPAAVRWLRRTLAVAILCAGIAALSTGSVDACEQRQSLFGVVSEVCHRPGIDDPVVLGTLFVVLLLLAPDLSEFSVLGLATVKMRLRAQEARAEAADAELKALRTAFASAAASSSARAAQSQTVLVDVGTALRSAEWAGAAADAPGLVAPTSRALRRRPGPGRPGSRASPPPTSPDSVHTARREVVAGARAFVGDVALRSVLAAAADDVRNRYGIETVGTHVYLPNDHGLLLPVDDPGRPPDESGWPPGVGLVGTVWRTGRPEIRHEAVAQLDLERLPLDRRRRYADTRLVLAVPIRNFTKRVIGVLSASSPEAGDPARDAVIVPILLAHGEALARVVIDVFRWDTDEPDAARMDGEERAGS